MFLLDIEGLSDEKAFELIEDEIARFYFDLTDIENYREEMFELDVREGNIVRDLRKHYNKELRKGASSYWQLKLKDEKKKQGGIKLLKDNFSLKQDIKYLEEKFYRQLDETNHYRGNLEITDEELRQQRANLETSWEEQKIALIEKDNEFAEYREEVFAEAFAIQKTTENTIDDLNTQKKALENKLAVLEATLQTKENLNDDL